MTQYIKNMHAHDCVLHLEALRLHRSGQLIDGRDAEVPLFTAYDVNHSARLLLRSSGSEF